MQLTELHHLFMNAIYADQEEPLLPAIAPGAIAAKERLAIYRNTIFHNLTNALQSAYPVIAKLVGEDFFHFAARHYIKAHPSTSGNLEEYGVDMAAFLCSFPPASSLAYLPDVARLEWLCHQAYHASQSSLLPVEQLAQLSAEEYGNLQFRFHPSCALLTSPYPLYRIWEVNQPWYQGDTSVNLGSGACHLMIIRDNAYIIKVIQLSKEEYVFLHYLWLGHRLYTAFEQAENENNAFDLTATLQKNIQQGIFTAYITTEPTLQVR